MSVRTKLEVLAAEWHQVTAQVEGHQNALADHLKSDWVSTKERYETLIEHFKERLAGIERALPKSVLLQLSQGASVSYAIDCHLNPPQSAAAVEAKSAE